MRVGVLLILASACAGNPPRDVGRRDAMTPDGAQDTGPDAMVDAGFDATPSEDCMGMPEATPCNADGNGCTMDLCRRERCVLGGLADCDDGSSCTTDSCVPTGPMTFMCTNEITANACSIDGVCVDDGNTNPSDACEICDAAMPRAWSISTGSCNDGDSCTSGDTCATGTCTGTPTLDAHEANDTRGAADRLPNVSDGDAFVDADTITPSIFPEGDVDWFVYNDSDDAFSSIFPQVELADIPSGSNYDLCVFMECESSFVDITCETGTSATRDGLRGCCSTASGNADERVRINPNCSGLDDSVDVYVEVLKVSGAASCEATYSLTYGDN